MNQIEELKKEVEKYFEHASHGYDHVNRVYKMAIKIAKKEKISAEDIELVKASALLHDIARTAELNGGTECHAEKGAEMAKPILEKFGYSSEKIEIISDAIRTHRYKNQINPKTKIGEVLQDADRLDCLGAIGISRILLRSGELRIPLHNLEIKPAEKYESKGSTTINHFYEKVLRITPDSFYTETAKKIAEKRYGYTKKFVEKFLKEWDGKE